MKAWIDITNVLHVQSETVYEALALKAWLENAKATLPNGDDTIPIRHAMFHPDAAPSEGQG